MNKSASSRALIIVSIENVYYDIKQMFRHELPAQWFDNNEVDEIILRIFNITISNILNNIGHPSEKLYKDCYQGNIDYLEYCGISQSTAFRIAHSSEMDILKSIFDTYPILDDIKMFKILDYKLMYKTDLHIVVEFNHTQTYEQNINCTDRQYSKLV